MPAAIPIIAAIAVNAAPVGSFLATYGALVMAGASIVAGLLQQEQARRQNDGNDPAQRGYKSTTRTTQVPHRVIYGRHLVAGNEVFAETSGSDNEYLWLVQNFAEGEISGIAKVGGVDQVKLDGRPYTEFGGKLAYWFYPGSAGQTYNTPLYDAHRAAYNGELDFSDWTDNKRHTAYGVFRLTFDPNVFSGKPTITLLLDGKLLHDFRDATTAWSDNAVLAAYDWFTNARYGLGVDPATVELDSWTSAANYWEAKGWSFNMIIDSGGSAYDVFEEILRHFRGALVWSGGLWSLRYADLNYESTVMDLGDQHLVRDEAGRARVTIAQPSRYNKPDGLRVKYIDAAKDYSFDDLPVGDGSGQINELRLLGTTSRAHAAEIGIYQLERQRLDRAVSLLLRDDCAALEPHDLVNWSCTARSIVNQLMRVNSAEVQADGLVSASLLYEDESLYNATYDLTPENVYICTLPDPTQVPPAVGNVVITEETYAYRLRTATRLLVTFDLPAAYQWFKHVEVWLSLDGGTTYKHQFNVTGNFNLDPVEEGANYRLKLITVSIHGVRTPDDQAYIAAHFVAGLVSVPDSLASLQAVVNANTVNLYGVKVASSDVDAYEFRLGTVWNGAVFLAALNRPNLSLYGVKPGEHTFWADTWRNNGQYGATPRSKTVSMIDPPDGWAVQHTETCSYSTGTHANTEATTYGGEAYLKCSHTAGELLGAYTSPVYDLGAAGRYLVYLQAAMAVTGTGTTWESQFPGTWEEGGIDRPWSEIFAPSAAPAVAIKLLYGTSNPPTEEVERLEILSAIVTGRYFQIEITITDPALALNGLVENFALKFCQM